LVRRAGGSLDQVTRQRAGRQAALRVSFDSAATSSSSSGDGVRALGASIDGLNEGASDRLRELQQTYAVWRSFRAEQQRDLSKSRSFDTADDDDDDDDDDNDSKASAAAAAMAEAIASPPELAADKRESIAAVVTRFAKSVDLHLEPLDFCARQQLELAGVRRIAYDTLNRIVAKLL
jgi:hypothetical protein